MSKKRSTAEEAAELLTTDNDPNGNDLESASEDDLSLKMKINQFYQTPTLMILKLA